jgi:nicotinate-nucleotide adenylyltransferase
VSLEALKRLQLDEIWWLVSPQNPLKSRHETADYHTRLTHAHMLVARHPKIRISTIESEHKWAYSIDTVSGLQRHFPHTDFVWLMGADNLAYFHRWRSWVALASRIPIAVFDRAPFTFASITARFAIRFASRRICETRSAALIGAKTPCWSYIHMQRNPLSSTSLRNSLGTDAFMRHNTTHKN